MQLKQQVVPRFDQRLCTLAKKGIKLAVQQVVSVHGVTFFEAVVIRPKPKTKEMMELLGERPNSLRIRFHSLRARQGLEMALEKRRAEIKELEVEFHLQKKVVESEEEEDAQCAKIAGCL